MNMRLSGEEIAFADTHPSTSGDKRPAGKLTEPIDTRRLVPFA